MNQKSHLERFSEVRGSAFVDPHTLSDDRLKIFWVLAAAKDDPELAYMTPAQIADILCDGEGIRMSRQRAAGILQHESGAVIRKRHKGRNLAVTMGFVTSPSPFQLFAFDLPNELISRFPLVLIPVFLVPLSVLFHMASLAKLRRDALRDHDSGGIARVTA
jgi:hypothetical protein